MEYVRIVLRLIMSEFYKLYLPSSVHPEKNLVKKEKNQSCFKLAEMARKLVGNIAKLSQTPAPAGLR